MAAGIQKKVLFGRVQRAEVMRWACDELNHTTSSAYTQSKHCKRCG